MNPMLYTIFGNKSAALTLMFLQNYGDGYSSQIAQTFGVPTTAIFRQLVKLESEGILVSREIGKSRVYSWNPRSATVKSLRRFLEDELERLPREDTLKFFRERRRPRRLGKPL